MKIRSIAIAVVAVLAASASASAAFADAPQLTEPRPAPRAQTLLDEVAAGMREILRAVSPEIALPAIEVKLPTLTPRRG
jgi:hypothetical protein